MFSIGLLVSWCEDGVASARLRIRGLGERQEKKDE